MYFLLVLKHKGCWSNILSKYTHIYGELISQKIVNNKYIEANIIFHKVNAPLLKNKKNKTNYFGYFFSDLRKLPDIMSFEKLESMNDGNSYLIQIHAQIENSISDIIDSCNPPYFREIFYEGFEMWYIFSWFDNVNKIIENIKKRSEIVKYERLEYNELETMFKKLDASKNITLLNEIYNSGYYCIKKNSNLGDLAKHYNVSKSLLSRKLRLIEIDAVKYYLLTHTPVNMMDKSIQYKETRITKDNEKSQ